MRLSGVVDGFHQETDGQRPNYVGVNWAMHDIITSIKPPSLALLSHSLLARCLIRVPPRRPLPKDGKHVVDHDEVMNEPDRGRWSFHFTICDLIDETDVCSYEGNLAANINLLIKGKLFYRFSVKFGRYTSSIYTYNRYIILIALFAPRKKTNWSPDDVVLPTVPRMLAALTHQRSYRNAVFRHRKYIHLKAGGAEGWKTIEEIDAKVKLEFCRSFIRDTISDMDASVRGRFVSFEEYGKSPDEYVAYVHETAKGLPPYEGVGITENFLCSLRLPRKYIENIRARIRGAHSADVADDGGTRQPIPTIGSGEELPIPTIGSQETSGERLPIAEAGVPPIPTIGSHGANPSHNSLNSNEFDGNGMSGIINTDTTPEATPHPTQGGGTEDEHMQHDGEPDMVAACVSQEVDAEGYNGDMNEPSGEQEHGLPFELLARDKPQRRQAQAPRRDPDDPMAVFDDARKDHERAQRRREKESRETILNSASKLVREFQQIVREMIPTAQFSNKDVAHMDDHRCAKVAMDELRRRGVLDEGVMRSWMRHAVEANKGRTYFKVGLMMSSLRTFERSIPTPDMLASRQVDKPKPATAKANPISTSLSTTFSDGLSDARVSYACQVWGVRITATYLSRTLGADEARRVVLASVRSSVKGHAQDAMSSTVKYESVSDGLMLDDWRTAFSDVLAKVGRFEEFVATPRELAAAREFVDSCGRGRR